MSALLIFSKSKTLRNFYTIIKVKPEIDQLLEGLLTLGVLQQITKYPDVMLPLFRAPEENQLKKGENCIT